MSFLFSNKSTSKNGSNEVSKEKIREWNRGLQHKVRELERQILELQRSEAKAKISCKKAVKDGQLVGAKILARDMVGFRKSILMLHTAKANLNSIMSSLTSQVAVSRVVNTLEGTTAILGKMNELIRIKYSDTIHSLNYITRLQ